MIARIFNVGDGCLCLLNNNVFERRRQPQGSRLFEFLVSGFATWMGGGDADERGWDARSLAKGCKFRILVSLMVLWTDRHHI